MDRNHLVRVVLVALALSGSSWLAGAEEIAFRFRLQPSTALGALAAIAGQPETEIFFSLESARKLYRVSYRLVDQDGSESTDHEQKDSLYEPTTLRLVSTKMAEPASQGGKVTFFAKVEQGRDAFSDAEVSEIQLREYSPEGNRRDENGAYSGRAVQLDTNEAILDTFGFVLFLYKSPNLAAETSVYYVDKGFVRRVQLTCTGKERIGGRDALTYQVTYQGPPAVLKFWIDASSREPLKLALGESVLVRTRGAERNSR